MAAKRSIPTNLFASPDFFELSSDTIRLIMIGLILDADDEGRGCAHPRLLARKLDTTPEAVAQALTECEAHGIVRCYTVEGRSYYVLVHWQKYQVLSRPTPSSYPPPPPDPFAPEVTFQGKPRIPRGSLASPGDDLPEDEGEGKGKEKESEGEEKRREAEAEDLPAGITRFPTPGGRSDGVLPSLNERFQEETTRVASLLGLPLSTQLETIVDEFGHAPTISLVGEAIEARAWIDDHRRNGKRQQMTPAFFRRWLKRACGEYSASAPGSPPARRPGSKEQHTPAAPAAMSPQQDADDPYQAYVARRLAEVKARYGQEVVG
jgi:hypothetical protein